MGDQGVRLTGFEDKVAVVTGAGRMRSIGRPIAVALAQAGCDVVLTGSGRSPERYPDDEKAAGWRDIESVAHEVRETGRRALPVVSDVTDEDAISRLVDEVMVEFGRIDILVNNAGAARSERDRRPVVDMGSMAWRSVLDINLTGTFLMSKAIGQQLVDGGRGGSIVNISSVTGKRPYPDMGAYAASKAGVQALTFGMSQEVAKHGVRVNALCPGVIDTARMDDLGRAEEWQNLVDVYIPLGRPGTGQDVANAVLFLCSDQGAWVTGQAWNIDGGSTIGI